MLVPEPLITTSPDRLSGIPVFAGTRVPIQTLIDYLEAGDTLDEFLKDFPSVSRELECWDMLVLDCDNTRYVIPAGLKRESIDFPGYPLLRV
jgi:uncharacterized protein (DUF433 family)